MGLNQLASIAASAGICWHWLAECQHLFCQLGREIRLGRPYNDRLLYYCTWDCTAFKGDVVSGFLLGMESLVHEMTIDGDEDGERMSRGHK